MQTTRRSFLRFGGAAFVLGLLRPSRTIAAPSAIPAAAPCGEVSAVPSPPLPVPAATYELDRFFIAGFQYHEGPQVISALQAGAAVRVYAEPENPYDDNAVRLEFCGRHIGYIPRRRNRIISRLLAQGAPVCGHIVGVHPSAEPWCAVEVAVTIRCGIK